MSAPERRAEAQVAFRELFYDHENGKLTDKQYEQAKREWQARYPEFMPGTGCCANISQVDQ